jgi:hypothetical protein
MPSPNPRLSVVLPPALAATLAALSEATGESASSLVRGILEQTHPALDRMLQLVKAAKAAKGEIGSGVGSSLARVVDDLEEAVVLADHRAGRVVRDLVQAAEAVKGRRRKVTGVSRAPAGGDAGNPRASNRGVRSSGQGSAKPRKGS